MLPNWTLSPERLERLRALCLALPDASEKIAWGDPTWRVKGRIFAMQKGNYDGGRPSLWLKAAPGAQETLVGARPQLFFVPPYVGHKGWVGIYLDGTPFDWDIVADLIVESYGLIAGPRLAALAAAASGPEAGGAAAATRRTRARRPAAANATNDAALATKRAGAGKRASTTSAAAKKTPVRKKATRAPKKRTSTQR